MHAAEPTFLEARLRQLSDDELGRVSGRVLNDQITAEWMASAAVARASVPLALQAGAAGFAAGISLFSNSNWVWLAIVASWTAGGWYLRSQLKEVKPRQRAARALRASGQPVFDECARRIAARAATRH